jgi:hypothetical protein
MFKSNSHQPHEPTISVGSGNFFEVQPMKISMVKRPPRRFGAKPTKPAGALAQSKYLKKC